MVLEMRLAREPGAAAREDARDEAGEIERPERPERLDCGPSAERLEPDRDRERETEQASFPLLLKTLNGVVAEAEALPGPAPAELPTLRELLARVGAAPTARREPAAASALKARLAGSTAPGVATLARPDVPRPSAALPVRRATGPPRR
jgi:hypothetical protein